MSDGPAHRKPESGGSEYENPEHDGPIERVSAAFGEGRYRIHGTAVLCGADVQCTFTGGTRPHVGAVSLAVYEPERHSATVSTLCVYTHRDDQLSAACAKSLSTALRCTAAVSVGIHLDNASHEDLQSLCENFEACRERLLLEIRKRREVHGETAF